MLMDVSSTHFLLATNVNKQQKPYMCVFIQFSRMMSDDSSDTFRNVKRKPGLQIWTISVSRDFNQ